MTAMVPSVDSDLLDTPTECDYRLLWVAALAQLLRDARCYWRGSWNTSIELEQAFDDLVRCGPMVRHVCHWLDIEPLQVTRTFIRWCEGDTAVTRSHTRRKK